MDTHEKRIAVIGGGLAGMRCARLLADAGLEVTLVEKQARLGGRVQTDEINGFLLDRGFQVLLTDYPEARDVLDFDVLDLRPFDPGALIRRDGRFHGIVDPLRQPGRLPGTLTAPVGTIVDKLKILRMRAALSRLSESDLLGREETTAAGALRERWGFSDTIIERFFRPFFGGIFLDPSLDGSSRMMEYVFSLFSTGHAAVPANGMGKISEQLGAGLGSVRVLTQAAATAVEPNRVLLEDGSAIEADATVVAVEGPEANRLLGVDDSPAYVGTRCHYFAADHAPLDEAMLVLNGDAAGPINNLVVMSNVSPEYSAATEALISVTVLGDARGTSEHEQETEVRSQLAEWFGQSAHRWRHVRLYDIPTALPDQSPPFLSRQPECRVRPGVYRCGDYMDTASINGALRSGRRAAEAVLADLRQS